MASNPYYGTGYPPYPQQYPAAQAGNIGYQPPPGYQQFTDQEHDEYSRQPAFAPTAPQAVGPASQPMMPVVVQQQPLYAPAPQQPQQQYYLQQQPPAVQQRPNVVVIHNTRSPNCFCLCLRAIFNLIWTIIVIIIIAVMVFVGIMILHRYVN